MRRQPGRDGREVPRRADGASPWPVLVAVGLVVGEVGVLFGVVAVGVAGVVLFGWSCAALLAESGLADSAWRAAVATGATLGAVGGVVWAVRLPAGSVPGAAVAALADPVALRGAMVCAAAGVLVVAGLAGTRRSAGR